ncbi:RDD family protein [Salinicoccus hispanicus]|uniref:RDD family protein n=1 Tax=Salinicoccus hispanicus TaxID=157225 RepID=A0A6N8U8C5_9STAP|nr:RDD family protein [Salinicoccus hispanicus]MXQ51919.1 RDD family protein [Salinicoccus hispanicus]
MDSEYRKQEEVPGIKLRFKALFFDWLFILACLAIVAIFNIIITLFMLDSIPEYTSAQSQLVATFFSVVPIIIVFSIMEARKPYASFGKRRAGLTVVYRGSPVKGSLIRNIMKFLPWQFGHMSTISGIYNGFDTPFYITFYALSMILVITYILMVLIRRDHRNLGDLMAGSTVVKNRD